MMNGKEKGQYEWRCRNKEDTNVIGGKFLEYFSRLSVLNPVDVARYALTRVLNSTQAAAKSLAFDNLK
jgi:hypothetical protein